MACHTWSGRQSPTPWVMTPSACNRVGKTLSLLSWRRSGVVRMEVTSPSVTSCHLPFISPWGQLHGYLQPPPREGGISGLGYSSGLVPVLSYHEMSGLPLRYWQVTVWKRSLVTLFTTTGSSMVGFVTSILVHLIRWLARISWYGTSHHLCHLNFFTLVFLALDCCTQPYFPWNPKTLVSRRLRILSIKHSLLLSRWNYVMLWTFMIHVWFL